jgi:hypothetical protein
MRTEDPWAGQTNRLKKLVSECAPGAVITFDENHRFYVRFRIADSKGETLAETKPEREWRPDELADMSYGQLWKFVQHLAYGKL